jgi:hypothetical protein
MDVIYHFDIWLPRLCSTSSQVDIQVLLVLTYIFIYSWNVLGLLVPPNLDAFVVSSRREHSLTEICVNLTNCIDCGRVTPSGPSS